MDTLSLSFTHKHFINITISLFVYHSLYRALISIIKWILCKLILSRVLQQIIKVLLDSDYALHSSLEHRLHCLQQFLAFALKKIIIVRYGYSSIVLTCL